MRQIRSITEAAQAEKAYLEGAEELFMAAEKVTPEMVSLAAQTPIPVTVCGGVRSMNDIYQLLKAGAQQVCLGQAAAAYSHLITQAARVSLYICRSAESVSQRRLQADMRRWMKPAVRI